MWLNRADYNFLQKRVLDLEKQLERERAENRRRENWMINMLLRRAKTFPVPDGKDTEVKKPTDPTPPKLNSVQFGQLEALRQTAKQMGRPQRDADEEFERIHGVRPPA